MRKFLLIIFIFVTNIINSQEIKITSPQKNDVIEKGSYFTIKWEFDNTTLRDLDLKIELVGQMNSVIVESIQASKKEYVWKSEAQLGEYRIIVSRGDLKGESETFTIEEKNKKEEKTII